LKSSFDGEQTTEWKQSLSENTTISQAALSLFSFQSSLQSPVVEALVIIFFLMLIFYAIL
jgi:hypothetical protein